MWITEKNAVFLKKKKKSNKMWITKTNLYTSKIAREKKAFDEFTGWIL